jgi:Ca-activated chloride channel family protein
MRFLQPELASWFLTVPLAIICLFLYLRARRQFRGRAAIDPHLRGLSRLSAPSRDIAAFVAASVAIGALVLAMMRPQLRVEMRTPQYEQDDLIVVLDRSVSMWAEDIAPSRLGRAVAEIKGFLQHKPDVIDRVGLVGFSGTSLIVSHLTRDLDSLFFYLDWIREDREPQFGTDIGSALTSSRELARKDGRPTKKIFLVISDGDDQGTELAKVLPLLRDERTAVYSIGIGSELGVVIPLPRSDGTSELARDERGGVLTTRFDETTLRGIADITGGRYVRSVTGTELAGAMQDMVRRERKLVGWKTAVGFRDFYRESLTASAVATLILWLAL